LEREARDGGSCRHDGRRCLGPKPFMFASDFPHEISIDNSMEEIDEILEREDLPNEHKVAILGDNARRFYQH